MRTVLIGTDFVYDKEGDLRPIEMNTSTGLSRNKLEGTADDVSSVFNPENLTSFISEYGFTKVILIGSEVMVSEFFSDLCSSLEVEYEFLRTYRNSITIPFVQDSETTLIIRQSYDTTALVDDTYCRDKIEFMKLIQSQSFGSEFAYKDENGTLVSNITTIEDNGTHPNFILKSRYPDYDKSLYPKLYKVSNQEELDVVLENVDETYFLMPYYFNESKIVSNKITKIRSLNILYPPTLESIAIGQYTDTSLRFLTAATYDTNTYQLSSEFRRLYITHDIAFTQPKLIDSDLVQLADGTFKNALDLQVGDTLKTIIIPNSDSQNINGSEDNYHINLETFLEGATYSTNEVKRKERVEAETSIVSITFTDGSDWEDTQQSKYLVENNGEIKFLRISEFVAGDVLVLIDTTDDTQVRAITKTVATVARTVKVFEGWVIAVDTTHIFLTKTEDDNSDGLYAYATLEHNCNESWDCPKFSPFCTPSGRCS
jgi:hypothetical protein